ncbi:MAG: tetratricopeptide repeat protein [Asgard group archaeon]|nr:tetratricopeptide repeat protein [Asgard group archaeon]
MLKNNTLSGVGGFLSQEEYLRKGHIYRKQGDLSRAFRSYCQALKLNPKSPLIWNNLGVIFYLSGYQSLAISCTRKALLLDPKYSNAKTNLETIEESRDKQNKTTKIKPKLLLTLLS